MLQRVREACKKGDFKLSGIIEIDETYIAVVKKVINMSIKSKMAGRGSVGKQAIMGLKQRDGNVIAMPINNTEATTLKNAISDNVEIGSQLYTDDFKSYVGLDGLLYKHGSVKHSAKEFVNGMAQRNPVDSKACRFKDIISINI